MKLRPFEYELRINVETPFLLHPDLIVNISARHPDGNTADFFFYVPDPVSSSTPSLSSYDIESALWDGNTSEAVRLRHLYTTIYNAHKTEIDTQIALAAKFSKENE